MKECQWQGEECNPYTAPCCGDMTCANYDGGSCLVGFEKCLCLPSRGASNHHWTSRTCSSQSVALCHVDRGLVSDIHAVRLVTWRARTLLFTRIQSHEQVLQCSSVNVADLLSKTHYTLCVVGQICVFIVRVMLADRRSFGTIRARQVVQTSESRPDNVSTSSFLFLFSCFATFWLVFFRPNSRFTPCATD